VERTPFSTQLEPEPQASTTITSIPLQPSKPLVLSKSLQTLLPALHAQPPYYITTHIHRFPYLITAGDTLRLPFHLHGVTPGDTLRFNRASILGSRDFTLKAGTSHNSEYYDGKRTNEPNYLDERLFECRLRVLGVESQPMTFKEKTKRRNRKVKTVKSKHKYTVLKVMEVKVKSLDELKAGKDVLLLE
jgi:large subunit ribosomal protein L21